MGYRSDVGIEFYAVDKDKVGVIKMWLRENLPFKDWKQGDDEPAFEELEDGFRFSVCDVKWYDGYPEIQRMHAVIDEFDKLFCDFDNADSGGAVEFIRLGEEAEDIEMDSRGDMQYRVNILREITFG